MTWYGKDEPIRVEPRLLIENAALSNCATSPNTENLLIHGDNLLALKALERKYAGQVKCAYIESIFLFGRDKVFATPKPERLIEQVLTLTSNPGDLVLDSFLGSGTTAAVAHKMGRRWIGVEMGEHAYTHCKSTA